eukprot:TRINITY_DN139_c0_g1_i1.p1 TRINITY_DN139_c0_g1~~TRINITY_DN139_c0_g1_i1.p1  ORF type:complete len:497 (-),score=133.56 TRINITY_DN139_c0_g1_i1:75-1565(-)
MVFVGSIDQGTTSSRFIIFDENANPVVLKQRQHQQFYPTPGWCEHDPMEIMNNCWELMEEAILELKKNFGDNATICSIGITNQRETTIIWDKLSGKPVYNSIVWLDVRTKDIVDKMIQKYKSNDHFIPLTGLPISTYFSAFKLKWIIENVDGIKEGLEQGKYLFGTVDSWLIWNLTGGVHCTDVTNASRTFLMDIKSGQWSGEMLEVFNVPAVCLPSIVSCAQVYGSVVRGSLRGVPVSGCIGDQQGSLVGQGCLSKGLAKSTYGSGAFLLLNVGDTPTFSEHGLLTTVGYQFGEHSKRCYALEGSIAIAGQSLEFLKNNLRLYDDISEVDSLAGECVDTRGVVFVPAFSGLFAPRWRPDARGVIVGMTQYTTRSHILRAAYEAMAFQTLDVFKAMETSVDDLELAALFIDGGVTKSSLLPNILSEVLGKKVSKCLMPEATAWGAAFCALVGVQIFDEHTKINMKRTDCLPKQDEKWRATMVHKWQDAIQRSLNLA